MLNNNELEAAKLPEGKLDEVVGGQESVLGPAREAVYIEVTDQIKGSMPNYYCICGTQRTMDLDYQINDINIYKCFICKRRFEYRRNETKWILIFG